VRVVLARFDLGLQVMDESPDLLRADVTYLRRELTIPEEGSEIPQFLLIPTYGPWALALSLAEEKIVRNRCFKRIV